MRTIFAFIFASFFLSFSHHGLAMQNNGDHRWPVYTSEFPFGQFSLSDVPSSSSIIQKPERSLLDSNPLYDAFEKKRYPLSHFMSWEQKQSPITLHGYAEKKEEKLPNEQILDLPHSDLPWPLKNETIGFSTKSSIDNKVSYTYFRHPLAILYPEPSVAEQAINNIIDLSSRSITYYTYLLKSINNLSKT